LIAGKKAVFNEELCPLIEESGLRDGEQATGYFIQSTYISLEMCKITRLLGIAESHDDHVPRLFDGHLLVETVIVAEGFRIAGAQIVDAPFVARAYLRGLRCNKNGERTGIDRKPGSGRALRAGTFLGQGSCTRK
jgi:hypothetical protein